MLLRLYLVWTWEAVYKSHQESNNRKCKKLYQEEVTVRKLFHSKSCCHIITQMFHFMVEKIP